MTEIHVSYFRKLHHKFFCVYLTVGSLENIFAFLLLYFFDKSDDTRCERFSMSQKWINPFLEFR